MTYHHQTKTSEHNIINNKVVSTHIHSYTKTNVFNSLNHCQCHFHNCHSHYQFLRGWLRYHIRRSGRRRYILNQISYSNTCLWHISFYMHTSSVQSGFFGAGSSVDGMGTKLPADNVQPKSVGSSLQGFASSACLRTDVT